MPCSFLYFAGNGLQVWNLALQASYWRTNLGTQKDDFLFNTCGLDLHDLRFLGFFYFSLNFLTAGKWTKALVVSHQVGFYSCVCEGKKNSAFNSHRTTDCFGLEETIKIISFQLSAMGRGTFFYPRFLQALSSWPWRLPGMGHQTSQIPPMLSILPYGRADIGIAPFLNVWHGMGVFHIQQNQPVKYLSDSAHDLALRITPRKQFRCIHPVLEK